MKIYKMSRMQMLGAFRAGKSVKYIADVCGATVGTVRYWIKNVNPQDLDKTIKYGRAYKRKGFRNISRSAAHHYMCHAQGQTKCDRCGGTERLLATLNKNYG